MKEEKSVSYFPFLVAKMLHRRSTFEGSFTLPSDRMNEFDAKQISPTIGMKEPPSTEELMAGPSRFENKVKGELIPCHIMLHLSMAETVSKISVYLLKFTEVQMD